MKQAYFFFLLLLAASCGTNKTATEEPKAEAPLENAVTLTTTEIRTAGIEVGSPVEGISTSYLKVSGLLDVPPRNLVSISFPLGGYLQSTRLLPGMRVQRGQVLAQMQDQSLIQLQQDYLVAKAKVGYLQKEYERQKGLNATKTTSDKVLEQTESEYRTQRVLIASLGEKLRMVGIHPASLSENSIRRSVPILSPISGYVSAVHVNIGKYVNPSDVLFELVNPADLHVALKVFEKDLPLLQMGQPVNVTLVNHPGKIYQAVVSLISRNLDASRAAIVHCHFRNAGSDLLPGMFANAEIAVNNKDALMVPEAAVVRWGSDQYIFLQRGTGAFEMLPVDVGVTNNGQTEISHPLVNLQGKPLIVKNAYAALMKLKNTE